MTGEAGHGEGLARISAAWKSDGKSAIIHNAPLGKTYKLRAEISGPLAPQFVPLFAAAPDMYEALKAAVEAEGPFGTDARPAWFNAACAALSKARG